MRAFVITGAGRGQVEDVDPPRPAPGEVVVDIERAGVCGTDVEFFTGEMAYLHTGDAKYPIRIGHEWCGVVAALGEGVDPAWLGERVTGDTMLGCGHCQRCTDGRQHLCADRYEIGIRGGWPGALAEQLRVPAASLHRLPDEVGPTLGAMVEPGGNAVRAFAAAAVTSGDRLLVIGPGTIGLLVARIAASEGVEVHLVGHTDDTLGFAGSLGFEHVWTAETLPRLPFDAVVDASYGVEVPALAVELVEPGKRVVFIGLSGEPSRIDSRALTLKDVTAVGVLSASGGLERAIELFASSAVDPAPLVAATVGLDQVAQVLARGLGGGGAAPKVHVDPRR